MVEDSRIFPFELFMDKKPQQTNQTSWLDPIGLDQLLLEVISSKRMKVERKLLKWAADMEIRILQMQT